MSTTRTKVGNFHEGDAPLAANDLLEHARFWSETEGGIPDNARPRTRVLVSWASIALEGLAMTVAMQYGSVAAYTWLLSASILGSVSIEVSGVYQARLQPCVSLWRGANTVKFAHYLTVDNHHHHNHHYPSLEGYSLFSNTSSTSLLCGSVLGDCVRALMAIALAAAECVSSFYSGEASVQLAFYTIHAIAASERVVLWDAISIEARRRYAGLLRFVGEAVRLSNGYGSECASTPSERRLGEIQESLQRIPLPKPT